MVERSRGQNAKRQRSADAGRSQAFGRARERFLGNDGRTSRILSRAGVRLTSGVGRSSDFEQGRLRPSRPSAFGGRAMVQRIGGDTLRSARPRKRSSAGPTRRRFPASPKRLVTAAGPSRICTGVPCSPSRPGLGTRSPTACGDEYKAAARRRQSRPFRGDERSDPRACSPPAVL